MSRAALVVNPTKCDATELAEHVERAMADAGWEPHLWLETTPEDAGEGMARRAIDEGVDLVFSCGGDGTVMSCVTGLAGSGVPMAVLPLGTGNLLARNLGLPLDVADAISVGLTGGTRSVDVGRVGDRRFVVMAGMGFDAAMMRDAPEALKARVGWPAYVVSGAKHLRDRRARVTLRVDGGTARTLRARTVLVGNVGRLQAGIPLLPDAEPDDGRLDVAVVAPRTLAGWLRVAVAVLRRRPHAKELVRDAGRRVEARADRPMARQLDGDLIEPARELVAEVEPGALLLRVPADEAHPTAAGAPEHRTRTPA